MEAITIQVFGRVQGVGFRFTTKYEADRLNILGTVKNLSDGSVYIEAQGSKENIANFISEIKKGPSIASKVEKTIISKVPLKQFNKFSIIY